MNAAGIRAIETALSIARDNLARAKYQKARLPTYHWHAGDGMTIESLIERYQKEIDDLLEVLADD